ncbi:MAG: hypothetical protein MUE30_09300 [Spirosomaceae bacterium]|nr:hypothetical protein [Spirosomataceae bacterium]
MGSNQLSFMRLVEVVQVALVVTMVKCWTRYNDVSNKRRYDNLPHQY